ncbi:MAG: response regulator, partial [Scytonema sp. CRU_2_7]|nr:response regulator [Scytonema sp. CRU_2_7]
YFQNSPTLPLSHSPTHSGARILLADDNADMRDYVKRLLNKYYYVETVPDGITALAAIRQHPPDLVLTDVMMPGMDGFELLRQLRREPHTREIPIILLSARAGEESRVEGLQAGADDYLVKPFSARELLARVEGNLKMAQMRQEAARREHALRVEAQAAKQELESILTRIDDQFLALDCEWRYVYVNDRVSEVVGMPKEEILGKSIWELFPDTVDSLLYTEVHRAVAEQTIVQFEYFYPRWQRWFENRVYPSADGMSIFIAEITERKQTEAALREQEQFWQNLTNTVPVLLWTALPDGTMDFVSQPWIDYTGMTLEAITQEGWQDLIHPDDFIETLERWTHAMQTGQPYEITHRIKRADGSYHWCISRAVLTRDEQQASVRWVGYAVDIESQKQVEASLLWSEARLKFAQHAAHAGIWDWDMVNDVAVCSEGYYDLHGFDPEPPLTYDRWMAAILEEDQERVDQQIRQTIEQRTELNLEFRVQHPVRGVRWLNAIGQTFYNADGQPIQMSGITLDVTDRKLAEKALRESEERLKISQLAAKTGTWDWNVATGHVFWSEEYYVLYGLDPVTPSTYENWLVTVLEEDREQADQVVRKALEQQQTILNFEFRIRHPVQGVRWFASRSQIFYDTDGQPTRAIGISIDITDRKQAEVEREQLLVRAQTAREQAETANRIKDEFLAVLSHELRSPLNPILGWSKLLLNGKLDATKTIQALQTIERNAKLQAQLIEDLLDVSRILRGKLSLNMTPVNLVSTIEAAIETVQLAAQAKSIQIQTVLDPNLPKVLGDCARLQQVIWNLLSNAVKFTESGGQVEICLECIDSQAQIQVSDTGKGIHSEFLPYVFEYFRQADATTTRKFGGLGLGLAIARHLVELHGGTVRAESLGEEQGATFTVSLPLLKEDKSRKDENNSLPPTPDASPLTGIRVLVVDDEADTRELIAFILEQCGASVTTAASALEALQVLKQTKPDLLLSDIGMPDMDGYMLMRQIRAMQSAQTSKVLAFSEAVPKAIALTAYAGEINQQQALAAGFQHHIAKPVDPDQLVQVIISLLNVKLIQRR